MPIRGTVRDVGLFDFLRGKPDEDPILGGFNAEPTGLEVTPVEGGAWTQTSSSHLAASAASAGAGGAPIDPMEMTRILQEAGGDPDKLREQLRGMFPGAQIDVQQSSAQVGGEPDLSQIMQTFFGDAQMPPLAAGGAAGPADDPIAQIERLAELHQRGALTDAEFAAAKAKLLG